MTSVRQHVRVRDFCKSLPPVPRKKLRAALRGLERDQGDIKPLEGNLEGYYRLRCGTYRVIFSIRMEKGVRWAICHYADHRSIVYSVLEARENLEKFLE